MENPWLVGTYTTLLLAPQREGQALERLAVPREATRGHPRATLAWPARPLGQGAALYLLQSAQGLGWEAPGCCPAGQQPGPPFSIPFQEMDLDYGVLERGKP